MAGRPETTERLNRALHEAAEIANSVTDQWFVMYGTLLGLVRDDGCIYGDDDVDIFINCEPKEIAAECIEAGLRPHAGVNSYHSIFKTATMPDFASIDFYICSVDYKNTWYCPWEDTRLKNVSIEKYPWRGRELNIPSRFIQRVEQMYGDDWHIPKAGKKVGRGKTIN